MNTLRRNLTVVFAISALACSTVGAQPTGGNRTGGQGGGNRTGGQGGNTGKGGYRNGQGAGPNGGDYDRTRDRDEGTEYGFVSTVRLYGAKNSAKIGSIVVRTPNGRQVSASLMDRTRYTLGGAEMERGQVEALVTKGSPVVMQWRYSNETGGRAAYSIEIRTVALQGTIKKIAGKHVSVTASPVQDEKEAEPVAPQIKAGGRPMVPPAKKAAAKPVVRAVTLLLNKDLTKITMDGQKADRDVLKPNLKFDAVVMDGGSNLILEIHVKSPDDSAPEGTGDDDKSKDGKGGTDKKRAEPPHTGEGKSGK